MLACFNDIPKTILIKICLSFPGDVLTALVLSTWSPSFITRIIACFIKQYLGWCLTLISMEYFHTRCPEKNGPQFLFNFSACKHSCRLGHISFELIDNLIFWHLIPPYTAYFFLATNISHFKGDSLLTGLRTMGYYYLLEKLWFPDIGGWFTLHLAY